MASCQTLVEGGQRGRADPRPVLVLGGLDQPFHRRVDGYAAAAGEGRRGSPRFAEMVVNAPKSLSITAALHPDGSAALDMAQKDAMGWLGQHSVTRVGLRGRQEVVAVEQLETVSVVHKTSRAGDPHRHIHFRSALACGRRRRGVGTETASGPGSRSAAPTRRTAARTAARRRTPAWSGVNGSWWTRRGCSTRTPPSPS
ncbi:relaxase domain-containing protein [Lacisediminihabitans sp.]|uniref:relaxase domain-containing protein n=1 Tax=Lacisediminihabitans sp. TaxID=2787631 RepID=UPI002F943A54